MDTFSPTVTSGFAVPTKAFFLIVMPLMTYS